MSSDGKSGAVAMLTRSRNPVSLARTVAEHVKDAKHLVGPQAEEALHRIHGDPKMIVDNTFFDSSLRRAQWDNIRAGRHRDIDDQKTALDHDVPSASAASSSSPASGSSSPRTPSPRSAAAAADAELDELERDLDQLLLDHGLCGTVGAVCWHATRGCAAATSTGGLTNKRPGRLGDSSVIGASTYASADSMALSATGIGEAIAKRVVAYDVHARMLYGGASLSEAVSACLHGYSASIEDANLRNALLAAQGSSTNFTANGNGMSNANGNGSAHSHMAPGTCGVVAVSASDGQIVMDWNTVGMFRAARHVDGRREIGIWREDAQEL
jgi:beta-aspartyl-peptidase (threonine type)